MGIPWWMWVLLLIVLVAALFFGSRGYFRNGIKRELLEYLHTHHPELEAQATAPHQITVKTAAGEEGTLFLDRMYGEVAGIEMDDLEGKREIFARWASVVSEGQAALEIGAQDGKRVFPRIVRSEFPDQAAAEVGSDPLPSQPLGPEGLVVVFVLDSEHSVAYLSQDQLQQLDLVPAEAMELAKRNLAGTFTRDVIRAVLDDGSISVVKSEDTYDAARLLLVSESLEPGESVAALIPDRDTLVLAPTPNDGDWTALDRLARNAAGEPLWRQPLMVTPQGIQAAHP